MPISAEKRASIMMTMAHLGGVAIVLNIIAYDFALPDFVKGLSIGLLLVSLGAILLRRQVDEYMQSLWNAGASAAFAAVVVLFLVGYLAAPYMSAGETAVPAVFGAHALALVVAAFYAGFHLRWLRSRA